jgi:hypothetical protein
MVVSIKLGRASVAPSLTSILLLGIDGLIYFMVLASVATLVPEKSTVVM